MVVALVVTLLAGCGADVSTVMNLNTAEGGFSGTRVITLLISNEDITSSVTGGLAGLETVLKENLPADLTYTISAPSDSESKIEFTLTFSSLDDYKTKVTNILAANAENEIVPEIVYEKDDTIFRTGLKFTENFQSFDLLHWYFNALVTADIISESSSNWYELGADTLVIDGVEADNYGYGHKFDYDEVTERYLSGCRVETVMNINGTFDRTIFFEADTDDLERLAEAVEDFEGYMRGIAPEGVTFTVETGEYETLYKYAMTGLSAEQIVAKTNAVMQKEGNIFTVTVQPKEGVAGTAEVTIEEAFDATYYLDPDYNYVSSTITTYPNFELLESDTGYMSQDQISYSISAGNTNKMVGQWLVGYEKTEAKVEIKDLENISVELVFTASASMSEDVRSIAFAALQSVCAEKAEFSKENNVATCVFSGTAAEVANKLDGFVKFYAPAQEGEEITYASIVLKEMNTASKFTNGISGNIHLDLSKILGYDAPVYLSAADGTIIATELEQDETGMYTESQIYIDICTERLDLVTVIVTAVFALLLLAGVAFAIINRAGFVEWFVLIKEKAKKPAAPAEAPAEVSAEAAVETPAEAAPAQESVEVPGEEEEDEIL